MLFCFGTAGHHQSAERLIECQYELPDKLSFFLCHWKPQHNIGEHYLIAKPDKPFSRPAQSGNDALIKLKEIYVFVCACFHACVYVSVPACMCGCVSI